MARCCPHCQGTGLLPPTEPGELLEDLKTACRERSYWVSADGKVREDVAADLLGLVPKTLSNWRYGDARLPYIKRAGRPLYSLEDLATYLANA
jgi:hypothetical protein